MRKLNAVGALVGAVAISALLSLTGCVKPFRHSDYTMHLAATLGWDHSITRASLCADYRLAYPGESCPDELRYGTGPA